MNFIIIKLIELWNNITYTELLVIFFSFQFIKFYYSEIFNVHYSGPLKHLPHPKHPLYHHFYRYYLRFLGSIEDYNFVHEQYGKIFVSAKNVVLVSDIEAFKLLNSYQFKKGKVYSSFDFNNPTIFSSRERSYHSKRKRLISPAFNAKSMLNMEPLILETGTLNLIQYLSSQFNKETSEIKLNIIELFYQSTLDVISHLVFGESLSCIGGDQKNFKYYMSEIQKIQLVLGLSPIFPFIKKLFPPGKPFIKIAVENMNKRKLEKSSHSDILQSMMDTQDEELGSGGLRDDEIIDEALTLLFAGMDTTSNTLTFTIYEILKNRELYDRIVEQIVKEFPDPNYKLTVEECRRRLPLLEAAILESMRYRPIAFRLIPRIVPQGGITIDEYFIPEGTVVSFNGYAANFNDSNFPNSREFNIDKWLGPNKEDYKSKLYAFSSGPRACIGKELAWAEMLLILSHLLHRFELELDPETKITPINGFLLTPKEKELLINIKQRKFN